MRISDWSSDVCSSDLPDDQAGEPVAVCYPARLPTDSPAWPRMGRYGPPGPLGGSAGIRRPGRGFAEGDRRVYMQVHEPRGQALRLWHHPEHRHIDPAIDVVLRSEEHTSELQSL